MAQKMTKKSQKKSSLKPRDSQDYELRSANAKNANEANENYVAKHNAILNTHCTTWSSVISLSGETFPLKQESLHFTHPKISLSALLNRELDTNRIIGLTAVLKDGKT